MLFSVVTFAQSSEKVPAGFVSFFNGNSLTNWKVPAGDNGHWKVLDAVIDYDAESEAQDKNLWTEKEYKDFVLYVDWRIKETPWKNPNVPLILPSGLHKKDEKGEPIKMVVPDSDSGIILTGYWKMSGEHLGMAYWFRRGIWLPNGRKNASRSKARCYSKE